MATTFNHEDNCDEGRNPGESFVRVDYFVSHERDGIGTLAEASLNWQSTKRRRY
jgi:hypothetical protein